MKVSLLCNRCQHVWITGVEVPKLLWSKRYTCYSFCKISERYSNRRLRYLPQIFWPSNRKFTLCCFFSPLCCINTIALQLHLTVYCDRVLFGEPYPYQLWKFSSIFFFLPPPLHALNDFSVDYLNLLKHVYFVIRLLKSLNTVTSVQLLLYIRQVFILLHPLALHI